MEFEWNPKKARANLKKHGVAFEEATQAFFDPNAIEFLDDINSDEEIRFRLLALSTKRLLFVGYTTRGNEVIRIITARKATAVEKRYYNESRR